MKAMNERNAILLRVGELVGDLQARPHGGVNDLFDRLLHDAARWVPGARYAGLTVVGRDGSIETAAYSHKYVLLLDDVARHHREGPSVSAARDHQTVRIGDLSAEERWRRYTREALRATPVRSILSLPMVIEPKSRGSLTLYAESTHIFDDDSVELGLVFATYAALAWNIGQRDDQFRNALASRDIIGQAKGMIMERFNIDAEQAFNLLKRLSQISNSPLAEVARRLVHTDHPPR